MRHTIAFRLNTQHDPSYGRWDIAPRVFGTPGGDYDGESGWLLSYKPKDCTYLVYWDDGGTDWINLVDFEILTGMVS